MQTGRWLTVLLGAERCWKHLKSHGNLYMWTASWVVKKLGCTIPTCQGSLVMRTHKQLLENPDLLRKKMIATFYNIPLLQHPRYSTDIASCDSAMFPHVKMKLKEKPFFRDEDLLSACKNQHSFFFLQISLDTVEWITYKSLRKCVNMAQFMAIGLFFRYSFIIRRCNHLRFVAIKSRFR